MTTQDGGRNRLPLTKFSPLSGEQLQAEIEQTAVQFWRAIQRQETAQTAIDKLKTEEMAALEDEIGQVKSQLAGLQAQLKGLLDQQQAAHQTEFTALEIANTDLGVIKRDLGWLLAERAYRTDAGRKDVSLVRAMVNGTPCALTVGTIQMSSYKVVDPVAFLDWLGPAWSGLVEVEIKPLRGGDTVNTTTFNDTITAALKVAQIANDPLAAMPKGIEVNPMILKAQAKGERPVRWVVLDETIDNLPTIEQLIESVKQPESEAVSATNQQ